MYCSILHGRAFRPPGLLPVLLPLITLVVLTACGSGQAADPVGERAMMAAAAPAPKPAPADSMHMYDSTYQRCSKEFDSHFRLAADVPIGAQEQEVPWAALSANVPTGSGKHGLRVEYGLSGNSLELGLAFLSFTTTARPDSFAYQLPDSLYDLHASTLRPMLYSAWLGQYQESSSNTAYFARVQVQRTSSSGFVKATAEMDTHAITMAWEDEVKQVYENNNVHQDSTVSLVLRCITHVASDGNYHHDMVVFARLRDKNSPGSGYRDLLSNAQFEEEEPFRMHCANRSNPCPPAICSSYIEPRP